LNDAFFLVLFSSAPCPSVHATFAAVPQRALGQWVLFSSAPCPSVHATFAAVPERALGLAEFVQTASLFRS
jgi:hypothetical protein